MGKQVFGKVNASKTPKGNKFWWGVEFVEREGVITLYVKDYLGAETYPSLTVDDAEAIGYSLLYAVKLQRDKEAETDG